MTTRTREGLKPERRPATVVKTAMTRARSLAWDYRPGPPADTGGFRILFYHRVSDDRDLLAVTPLDFRRQMEMLADDGFAVLDLMDAWRRLVSGDLPERAIVLNFDDGYLDFAQEAWPVLRDLGFPATVFIAPGLVDGSARMSWYERQPPLLSWDGIRELQEEGVRFEPHTMTHPNLSVLDDDACLREIAESRAVLEDKLGGPRVAFCYPGGTAGERERRHVADAGMQLALGCEPGMVDTAVDTRWLPRIAVGRYDGLRDVRAKAEGGHDRPLPGRGIYRTLRYGRLEAA
jgi:peptidoglycan/xylan/chitin deacetylase (PgdA/CDA1 family)